MKNLSILYENVRQHYSIDNIAGKIFRAMEQSGKDPAHLNPEMLASVDEFHIRGREATLDLGRMARLNPEHKVLDIGSGIGGPSRCLASEFGCRVKGIDLTDEYCQAATELSKQLGLSHLVEYWQGDALNMPFPNDSFDIVWTQHVTLNIPDKMRFYHETGRVLKPGGSLALYNIVDGGGGQVIFPVPWAKTPETSFLVNPEALQSFLERNGFSITYWENTTKKGLYWFIRMSEQRRKAQKPETDFQLLMGPLFPEMIKNQIRNLRENRINLVQVLATINKRARGMA